MSAYVCFFLLEFRTSRNNIKTLWGNSPWIHVPLPGKCPRALILNPNTIYTSVGVRAKQWNLGSSFILKKSRWLYIVAPYKTRCRSWSFCCFLLCWTLRINEARNAPFLQQQATNKGLDFEHHSSYPLRQRASAQCGLHNLKSKICGMFFEKKLDT